jgi:hypothetical protein
MDLENDDEEEERDFEKEPNQELLDEEGEGGFELDED